MHSPVLVLSEIDDLLSGISTERGRKRRIMNLVRIAGGGAKSFSLFPRIRYA